MNTVMEMDAIEKAIKEKQCTIIDVRAPFEFEEGNVVGSINIPLQELPQRLNDLKEMKAPLIMCCASGNRSRQATLYLAQEGITAHNGGSWMDVNFNQQ